MLITAVYALIGSYQEDIDTEREWIQCICKRWLHDDEDIDSNGKLCPLC